jgi:methionine-rich copper-binding protein CopC
MRWWRGRTWHKRMALAVAAGAVLTTLAPNVAAHPILVRSTPAPGAQVASPERLELRFNSRIEKTLSSVSLIGGPEKTAVTLARPEPATTPEVLTYRLPALAPGRYEARWKVLAADGHVGEGVVSFTVTASTPAD